VFNATFNNISAISWCPVLLVEETRQNHRHVAIVTDKLYLIRLHGMRLAKSGIRTLFSYEMFLTGEFVCVVEVGDVVINYCLIFYFQLLEPLFYVIKFNNQRKLKKKKKKKEY
jgi:hypothetical protein